MPTYEPKIYSKHGTDNKLVAEIPLNMKDSKKLKQKIDTERPLEPREIELLLSWFKHRQGKSFISLLFGLSWSIILTYSSFSSSYTEV